MKTTLRRLFTSNNRLRSSLTKHNRPDCLLYGRFINATNFGGKYGNHVMGPSFSTIPTGTQTSDQGAAQTPPSNPDQPSSISPHVFDLNASTVAKLQSIPQGVTVVINCTSVAHPSPCNTTDLEQFAENADGKLVLAKVSVDTSPEIAQQLGVQKVPTVVILKDGKMADRFVGQLSNQDLKTRLSAAVGESLNTEPQVDADTPEGQLTKADALVDRRAFAEASAIYSGLMNEYKPYKAPKGERKDRKVATANATNYAMATVGLVKCVMGQSTADQDISQAIETAQSLLDDMIALSKRDVDLADAVGNPAVTSCFNSIAFAKDFHEIAEVDTKDLEQQVLAHENKSQLNHTAHYQLAVKYFTGGDMKAAVDIACKSIRVDKTWEENRVQKLVVRMIESAHAAGQTEISIWARRRLNNFLYI